MSIYVSKDYVHYGCGLTLTPEIVWESVPYSVQKNIKKAEKNKVTISKVSGTKEDINVLRNMWYDPKDPNMPTSLREDEFMFVAYNSESQPIGAVILLPVGNHLFLNNLAGNEEGKNLRVQDYLLWHCVNYFENSKFKYIDVGVSYRLSLYEFFKKWQMISYPVIFNVPQIKLHIDLHPFDINTYHSSATVGDPEKSEMKLSQMLCGRKYTFLPNVEESKKVFERLNLDFIDNTFNFTDESEKSPFIIDLTQLFSVQFGVLVVNLELDDKQLWNEHRTLDVYKREFVFNNIAEELSEFDVVVAKRKRNIEEFNNYFALEGIHCIKQNETVPSAYYFYSEFNERYHNRLNDFGISHYYNENNKIIGLPVHQNIKKSQIEYIYAIYRGVLNLCSEWVHTDYYTDIK